jgi:hypothetical protein
MTDKVKSTNRNTNPMTDSEVIAVCLALRDLRKFCVLEQVEADEAVDTAKNAMLVESKADAKDTASMITTWEGQSMALDDVLGRIDCMLIETIDTIEDKCPQ